MLAPCRYAAVAAVQPLACEYTHTTFIIAGARTMGDRLRMIRRLRLWRQPLCYRLCNACVPATAGQRVIKP